MEALKKAEINPPFRIYDLRHTFSSRSAMAGVDLLRLKELMGHSEISITLRYIHPTPERKQVALQKLERFNHKQACGGGNAKEVPTMKGKRGKEGL